MQLSCMTVSIPLDIETKEEIKELLHDTFLKEQINYEYILSVDELSDHFLKGFCVLAYDDATDQLVGVLKAVDRIATLDYEWSAVVLPSARNQGIGERLIKELSRNLNLRGAETELVLVPKVAPAGQKLLKKLGYIYDFSECTMVANAEESALVSEVKILPFSKEEQAIIEVLTSAFGDTEDEAREFIAFHQVAPNRRLMCATINEKVLGTVSIVEESDKLWVSGLAVHEKAQGKGVGTAILNWSKNEAQLTGKKSVFLEVEMDNEKALSVYKKAGFQVVNYTNFYRKG